MPHEPEHSFIVLDSPLNKRCQVEILMSCAYSKVYQFERDALNWTDFSGKNDWKIIYCFKFWNPAVCEWSLSPGPLAYCEFLFHSSYMPRGGFKSIGKFDAEKSKSPVWIKLSNVPLQLMNLVGLSRVASAVGNS